MTGEDTLEVSGHAYPCWIVETRYDRIALPRQETFVLEAVQTAWISKSEGLSLQNTFNAKLGMPSIDEPVTMTQTTRTTALRLNPNLPDSVFVFRPLRERRRPTTGRCLGLKPDALDKSAPDVEPKSTWLRCEERSCC